MTRTESLRAALSRLDPDYDDVRRVCEAVLELAAAGAPHDDPRWGPALEAAAEMEREATGWWLEAQTDSLAGMDRQGEEPKAWNAALAARAAAEMGKEEGK